MSKFDKLYNLIMENAVDKDTAEIITTFDVFDWNNSKKDFSDLKQQVMNFHYTNLTDDKRAEVSEYSFDKSELDQPDLIDSVYRKVVITDKHSGQVLEDLIIPADKLSIVKSLFAGE